MTMKPPPDLAENPSDIDWASVFPSSRIKSLLQQESGIGVLPKQSVDLIGACSALFVKQLWTQAINSKDETQQEAVVVTVDDVRRAIESNETWHDVLSGVLKDFPQEGSSHLSTSTASLKRPARMTKAASTSTRSVKRAKKQLDPSLDDKAAVEEALEVAALQPAAMSRQSEIVADEEDYD